MNAHSKNSFRQKMFECAVMIIVLPQTACATNITRLGGGSNDRTTLICSMDMPREVSAQPKAQPTTAIRLPQNAQLGRDEEEYNLPQVEETLHQTEEAFQQVEEVLNVIELIESWDMLPGAKKVIVGTTITGAAIGGLVAHQHAKDDDSDDPDSKDVLQGVVTGAVVGAEVGNAIIFIGGMIVFVVSY